MPQQQHLEAVTLRSGILHFAGDQAFIGRDSDFRNFLELSEHRRLHRAAHAMRTFLSGMANSRTASSDLVKQRLAEVSRVLTPAV